MRILLITGHLFMAEGTIAKGISEALSDQCQIFFFSIHEFKHRYNEFIKLTKSVDIVHWIFNVAHLDKKYVTVFKELNVPTIATIHHVDADEVYKIREACKADLVHTVSSEWLDYLTKEFKVKVMLAPLGVSYKSIQTVNTSIYKGEGTFKIGIMGFYPGRNNRKRFDIALSVLEKLLLKNLDIELVVQGSGWENFYEDFNKIGLKFVHSKFKSDKKKLQFFENIHVYLCTSDIEGGPFPVLESMALGIPVVSTKVGIAIDLIAKGGGVLCDKGDVEGLVNALVLLKNDNIEYKKNTQKAQIVASEYIWENLENNYRRLYEGAIERWEKNKIKSWNLKTNKIVNSKNQQIREKKYSDLHQIRSLLMHKSYGKGLILLVNSLFSKKITFKRKYIVIKEAVQLIVKEG